VAFATFLLVIAGGLVTSTGSALAVPDWPLANGQFFPKMAGGVLFEHGHRLIAATVGLLTIVLAVWTVRKDPRPGVRRLGIWAIAAVVTQGLLGGITVIYRLPPVISVAHACLAQTFFTIMTCLAVLTGPWGWMPVELNPSRDARKLRSLALMTAAFIALQVLAGATLRHTGRGLGFHILVALLVAIHVLLLARRVLKGSERRADLRTLAISLTVLLGTQLMLGGHAWRTAAVAATTAHVATGALMLACSVALAMQTFRRMEPAR
jgi:cytochrome c oxidase assembly protein subunit 15